MFTKKERKKERKRERERERERERSTAESPIIYHVPALSLSLKICPVYQPSSEYNKIAEVEKRESLGSRKYLYPRSFYSQTTSICHITLS
jgi:hypothetical protein